MKVALISRSGLLEFRNSRVLSRLQRYLRIMKEAMTQEARDCPLTEWTRTLSYSFIAESINWKISLVILSD